MHERSSSKRALLVAVEVFVVLLGLFLYGSQHVVLNEVATENILRGTVVLVLALVTVIVYQSLRITDTARDIAKGMTKDMLVYSRELFSELYRGSPVPYILIEADGRIESTNYAAVRLFGIEEGEIDGMNVFDLLETEDEVRIGIVAEKLKQGLFVNEEGARIHRRDGVVREVLLSLFSFKDSVGVRKGLLTLVDITKQKQIDRAKTEFVSLASHQLRTPISAMKWSVELLHTANPESFTALQKEYMLKIARSLVRIELLIEDFLNVSKFELGTLATKMTDFAVGSFIDERVDELRERASAHRIRLEVVIDDRDRVIHSDTHVLTMIVTNLLSNAIKYTKDGGLVRLVVAREGGHLVIRVSDTGIGIPKEEQEHIFSKIFRASNAREQVSEGTGLGLYIVREAAKVLGGAVTFVSEEGVGTTFTVVLPM